MDLQNKKILTLQEAAEYLGYKKSYVYQMVMQSILPFSKPNRGKIFFEREKLDRWMLSNGSKTEVSHG
jgi:excisionase family DNA binding protein